MPTRDRLAAKTKQGATSIVNCDWHISVIKVFIDNAPSYRAFSRDVIAAMLVSQEQKISH
jgi:hypothetical protein